MKKLFLPLSILLVSFSFSAQFREYPIGDPIENFNLKIAAVYFPAVPMDHSSMMHGTGDHSAHTMAAVTEKDVAKEKFVKKGNELIHLEADIHATKGNKNGFGAGEWIPYLTIAYQLIDTKTKQVILSGDLMPMVAADGPHYGTTLRMPGVGHYQLKYEVSSPALARHSDKLTGVAEYWKAFDVQFDFEYEGLQK